MERKKKVIQYSLYAGVLVGICMLAVLLVSRYLFEEYQTEVRSRMAAMLGTIEKQYPDVRKDELIKLLNADENVSGGEKLLSKYGITDRMMVFSVDTAYQRRFGLLAAAGTGICGVSLLVLFLLFYRKRELRLQKLTEYMQRVQRRDYSLSLADNSEDSLSRLQNEIYKLTVMLKEGMEREKHQREAVLLAVSDISHQLKTPMTSMQIMTDNLIEAEHMPEQVRLRFLREIARQIEGVNWLVQALLRMSRLDADVVTFAHERICAAEFAETVCDRLAVLAEVKEVKLAVTGSREAVFYGDEGWCAEAFANLVKNAVEHSSAGQTVTIHIQENDIYMKLEIIDQGEGIAPEDCKHIFDRFYKAKNASPGSVGIGLAMAKSIVEKQGGYISIDSTEGEGTIVTIKFMKIFYQKSPESHLLSLE